MDVLGSGASLADTDFRFRAIGSLNPVIGRFSGLNAVEATPNENGGPSPLDLTAIVGQVPFSPGFSAGFECAEDHSENLTIDTNPAQFAV
jgi:hypothetical protein